MTELNIRFNTDRPYTEGGQIIYATWGKGGMVKFADVSRKVYGRFNPNRSSFTDEADLQGWVMSYYDNGHYEVPYAAYEYFLQCIEKEKAQ